ncbi:MAG TPA: hypothetical protein VK116_08320 [Planctomycetota bacterium]|nr:hypothetical protein [Planctomycetota bacterium]
MIIVDEIVWAAYFTGQQSKHVARLDQALEKEEDLALVADRLTALLEGFRREADFRKMRQTLLQLPLVSPSVNARVEAAVLCRKLRSKRVKIERPTSCLVSQTCVELGAELLSPHPDFAKISKHSRLKLCTV